MTNGLHGPGPPSAWNFTEQVLRLFLANVKDWSEDAPKKHDPEFHHAVVHGMEWTVLSADLLKAFPKIIGAARGACIFTASCSRQGRTCQKPESTPGRQEAHEHEG